MRWVFQEIKTLLLHHTLRLLCLFTSLLSLSSCVRVQTGRIRGQLSKYRALPMNYCLQGGLCNWTQFPRASLSMMPHQHSTHTHTEGASLLRCIMHTRLQACSHACTHIQYQYFNTIDICYKNALKRHIQALQNVSTYLGRGREAVTYSWYGSSSINTGSYSFHSATQQCLLSDPPCLVNVF